MAGVGAGAAAAAGASALATSGNNTGGGAAVSSSGATAVSHVADQHAQGATIQPGSVVHVLHPYQASLGDELTLNPGMSILVDQVFDDGWGSGKVISGDPSQTGKTGQFPAVCVSTVAQ